MDSNAVVPSQKNFCQPVQKKQHEGKKYRMAIAKLFAFTHTQKAFDADPKAI